MLQSTLLLLGGLAILTIGAEFLVRGASGIAKKFGLSPLVIGLTVVAFGTSAPELAIAVKAALGGSGDLMVGNVIGSNIFNVAVILAISAIVTPLAVNYQAVRVDMPIMLVASALFTGFCFLFWQGEGESGLMSWEGGLMFVLLVLYISFVLRLARKEAVLAKSTGNLPEVEDVKRHKPSKFPLQLLMAVLGLAGLTFGADLMVTNAISLAQSFNVSEAVIAITIVAAGTSLPELATSVVAAIRKETDMAVGNIVGSNIFNLLCIGGITPLVAPVAMSANVTPIDFGVMLLTSALLLPFMRTGFKVVRWEGLALLAIYGGYLFYRWPK